MNEKEQLRYTRAKERVAEIRGFYVHVLVYAIAMSAMAYVNYITTEFPWVIFPLAGWGLGLLSHGVRVYNLLPFFGKQWEERKIRELMDKDNL